MDKLDTKEIECLVFGRVQLVMFRDFAQRNGRKLGLAGTVQNLPDGSMRVVAQGPKDNLEKFIELLKKGPILSEVEKVQISWREPLKILTDFKILYD